MLFRSFVNSIIVPATPLPSIYTLVAGGYGVSSPIEYSKKDILVYLSPCKGYIGYLKLLTMFNVEQEMEIPKCVGMNRLDYHNHLIAHFY